VLVAIAVGQTVERTGQIMISFHFRWWRAHTRTRTTVAVEVSRAINKRETIAAVHIHSHTRAQVVDLLRFIITPRAILWSCIPLTYMSCYFFLKLGQSHKVQRKNASGGTPVGCSAGMRLNIDLLVPNGRARTT